MIYLKMLAKKSLKLFARPIYSCHPFSKQTHFPRQMKKRNQSSLMMFTALVDSSPMYDYSMKPTGRLLTRDGFDRSLANKQVRHALMLHAGFVSLFTVVLVLNSYNNNTVDISVRQKVPCNTTNMAPVPRNSAADTLPNCIINSSLSQFLSVNQFELSTACPQQVTAALCHLHPR